jgi:hypothetical protein
MQDRFPNNTGDILFTGTPKYNFPYIYPEKWEDTEFLCFDKAMISKRKDIGVHFWMDDYQFERIWYVPDRYLPALAKFKAVIAPDFSPYRDWPMILQMWNHYRKHYIAARLQHMGVKVYANIGWSTEESFEWCFDGEPRHSTVMISSVGSQKDPVAKKLFLAGYKEMLRRLEPETIVFFGTVPEGCEGNIIRKDADYVQRRKRINATQSPALQGRG